MSNPSNLINYLANCYQSDNRELSVVHFFKDKIEDALLLEDADLLEGNLPVYPIEKKWAEQVLKKLSLHSYEKDLYTCAFFVTGKTVINAVETEVIAPLLLIPTVIEVKEDYFIRLKTDQIMVNSFVFRFLSNDEGNTGELINDILSACKNGVVTFETCCEIKKAFESQFKNIDFGDLLIYPKCLSRKEINKHLDKTNAFSILSAVGLGVINKSSAALGSLVELIKLTQENNYSKPLMELIEEENFKAVGKEEEIILPAILNDAQITAIQSVNKFTTTLIIGPPGTGKSFTIAAVAAHQILNGKSVLIASANDQAVDVVANKISNDFGLPNVAVRGGGKSDYKKYLVERLTSILHGIGIKNIPYERIIDAKKRIKLINEQIHYFQKQIQKAEKRELKRGKIEKANKPFYYFIQSAWIKWRVQSETPLWQLLQDYLELLKNKNALIQEYVGMKFNGFLYETLKYFRKDLRNFLNAIRARTYNKKDLLFDSINLRNVQRTFPIWLINISEISKIFPLEKDLFDVVIIDEATQCNMASVLPLIQRGKKLVVSGDPKQLRHVSFLSKSRQSFIGNQFGLTEDEIEYFDYRGKSLLDVVNDKISNQEQVVFLNEHYRSLPGIIEFSSKEFYSGALRIMTSTPIMSNHQHVFIHRLQGKKTTSGINWEEVNFIVEQVAALIEKEKDLDISLCQSIGILSPFREQVNGLFKAIYTKLTPGQIDRHKIMIGTAYSFQGEERDIMFLSLAIDDESHFSALYHLNKPDVFNVSVTRARSLQHVVTSFDHKNLKHDTLLSKYLYFISDFVRQEMIKTAKSSSDSFMKEVIHELRRLNIVQIYEAYPIAGLEIDLVVVKNQKTFCIDLIGNPGFYENAFPLERHKILNRIGIQTFLLPYSNWFYDKRNTMKALGKFLDV